jgi:uncharacterized membrane protein
VLRNAVGKQLDHDPNFRWRGEAVTRIENLSDIAFALALGMLISGVDAPQSFEDLIRFLIYIIPAALGFAILLQVWTAHYTFFRRYGVADKRIIFYNAILIFLVLYMAYPLRFVFDSLFSWIMGAGLGDYSRGVEIGVMGVETSGKILAVFGVIYGAVFLNLALMYQYILSKAQLLDLNSYELSLTQRAYFYWKGAALLSFLVAAIAYFTPLNGFAGFILCFTGLISAISRKRYPAVASSEPDPAIM